jgi:hypothetical protein
MPKSTQWNRCTAQAESGDFCDAPAMDGAPFPICIRHGAQMLRFMQGKIADFEAAPVARRLDMLDLAIDRTKRNQAAFRAARWEAAESVVYYVQLDHRIKIGYSATLHNRLKAYPPNRRLLATEPGADGLEAIRLREFAEYLAMGREWFTLGPRLLVHVNELRKAAGTPPLTIAS